MSRIRVLGALGFAFSGLALGACATSGPEAPEPVAGSPTPPAASPSPPAAGGPPPAASLPPAVLAALAEPAEVDVVEIEVTGDEAAEEEIRITCDIERKPGTRIVVGQTCERVGGPSSGIAFHPDDWDLKIKSPGVYEMRRRQ